jgi:hypothetical protein
MAMDANDFIIRQPKASLKVYIFITILFFLMYILSLVGLADGGIDELKERWWVFLLAMSPLLLLGPFFIFLWYRWKITVKENQITACSYFSRKKTFTFDYITKVHYGNNLQFTKAGQMSIDYMKAYHEKKKVFTVTSVCPGFQTLNSRLKDEGVPVEWNSNAKST